VLEAGNDDTLEVANGGDSFRNLPDIIPPNGAALAIVICLGPRQRHAVANSQAIMEPVKLPRD